LTERGKTRYLQGKNPSGIDISLDKE